MFDLFGDSTLGQIGNTIVGDRLQSSPLGSLYDYIKQQYPGQPGGQQSTIPALGNFQGDVNSQPAYVATNDSGRISGLPHHNSILRGLLSQGTGGVLSDKTPQDA